MITSNVERRSDVQRGITLVEVMMVMTIMTITAALFMTTISDVRQAARAAACQTNLRQFHMAIFMFSDQRPSGRLPTGEWAQSVIGMVPPPGGYRGDQFGAWLSDLVPFGMTDDLLHCPAIPEAVRQLRWPYWYYHRHSPLSGMNGNDYLYQGGHGNHPVGLYGWIYGHATGYFLTTTLTVNSAGDPVPPSDVIYMSDIAYNKGISYASYYYGRGEFGVADPSNHAAAGEELWQAVLSNRLHADGHTATFTLDASKYGKGTRSPGSWASDYYANYW